MNSIELHKKLVGKLRIKSAFKVETKEDLSLIYTPGVGEVCKSINSGILDHRKVTNAGRTVAVISDGSAVLGFGNIEAKAALPVMEGKSVIFNEFAELDSYPICIEEQDVDIFIDIVKRISINFAAINLEDISAPRCFEIEERLSNELDIPIIHDDQHGTAIVTLSALLGAVTLTGKKDNRVVVLGAGAAGTAITKLILFAAQSKRISIAYIKVFDSQGLISSDREDLNKYKRELAVLTKQTKTERLSDGLSGADIFIGVSVANALQHKEISRMSSDPIIFALANPVPEVDRELAIKAGAYIVATGRSDYPNQINNALAYPDLFKGLLTHKIKKVEMSHKLLVAETIYKYHLDKLDVNNLLPSILDKSIPEIISNSLKSIK